LKNKLSAIADIKLGKMLDVEKNKGELQPYIGNINVRWGSFDLDNIALMKFEESEYERYELKYGDLIVCEGGEPGRCAIWENQLANIKYQKALHRVRGTENVLNNRYLMYWLYLAYKTGKLKRFFTGSTIYHLPMEALSNIEIDLPDYNTQTNIAKTIEVLDRKIALNNSINAELEKAAKLIYDYWFVQFDFPNAEGKPYRASGGEMVYNEQLKRKIPYGWETRSIKQCVSSINTGLNPRQNFKLGFGENRYITIKNIVNGRLDFSSCDVVDDEALSKIRNRSDIAVEDILFTSIDPVGRLYWIRETPTDWDINESVFSIRTNMEIVSTEYFYAVLDSVMFRAKLIPLRTGSVQKGIRIGALEAIYVVKPNETVMEKFSTIIRPIYREMGELEKQNKELTTLRDFLLPLLMNGQVSVGAAEKEAVLTPFEKIVADNEIRYQEWKKQIGLAARGDIDEQTLRNIYEAMDENDK